MRVIITSNLSLIFGLFGISAAELCFFDRPYYSSIHPDFGLHHLNIFMIYMLWIAFNLIEIIFKFDFLESKVKMFKL